MITTTSAAGNGLDTGLLSEIDSGRLDTGAGFPALAVALANPGKETGKSRRTRNKVKRNGASAATAAAAVVTTDSTIAVASVPVKLSPAEIVARARQVRANIVAQQAAMDPDTKRTIDELTQTHRDLLADRDVKEAELADFRDGLARKLIPAAQAQAAIEELEDTVGQINELIEQIGVSLQELSAGKSVVTARDILRSARLRVSVQQLFPKFAGAPSVETISNVVDEAANLKVVKVGEGEQSFRWGRNSWISAVDGDPLGFGFVPRMMRAISEHQRRAAARTGAIREHMIQPHELDQLVAGQTTLSELIAGSEGYTLVPQNSEKHELIGYALVERDGSRLVVRRVSDMRIFRWFCGDPNGDVRKETVLKFDPRIGEVNSRHAGIKSNFTTQWQKELPIRRRAEAVRIRDKEIANILAGKKVNAFSADSVAALLKPTSAGAGYYPVTFDWKVDGGRKAESTPCGLVLQKKGTKIAVVAKIPAKLEVSMDEFNSVSDPPLGVRSMIELACQQAGIEMPGSTQSE